MKTDISFYFALIGLILLTVLIVGSIIACLLENFDDELSRKSAIFLKFIAFCLGSITTAFLWFVFLI